MFSQIFNAVDATAINCFLATEGIKCIAALWGVAIKGKAALLLFLVLLFVSAVTSTGLPHGETYAVLTITRALSAVGIYSFLSRLYDALERRK